MKSFELKPDHKDQKKELHFNAEKCECLVSVENVPIPQKVSDVAARHEKVCSFLKLNMLTSSVQF
jgi:hypothetical protein